MFLFQGKANDGSALDSFKRIQLLLIVLAIVIGIALRIYGLENLGPWSDELASLYFAENIQEVFSQETHPPLFYIYLKPFIWLLGKDIQSLRSIIAITGMLLISYAIYLASKIFSRNEVITFTVLILLCHVEIVHTRMIRQYSLFFDLALILMLLSHFPSSKGFLKFSFGLTLSGVHPFGFLIPLALGIDEILKKRAISREIVIYLSSIVPVSIYYISKIFANSAQFSAGYSGEDEIKYSLAREILMTLSGEHFPKINSYPISTFAVVLTLGFIVCILIKGGAEFIKSKKINPFFRQTLIIFLLSVLFTEVFSQLVTNIRLGRYFAFLLGPLILSFVSLFRSVKWISLIVFTLQIIMLVLLNPTIFYEGEREAFLFYKRMKSASPQLGLVLCANKFQYRYYLNENHQNCYEQYERLKKKKIDFVFIDMNGFARMNLLRFTEYNIEYFKLYGISSTALAYHK